MRIAFKTLIVSFGQLASSAQRALVVIVLSRTLSTLDYGTYQQVWLFYTLVTPLFTLGLPSSVLYFIPKTAAGKHKTVVFQTLSLLGAVGAVFGLATFFTAPYVAVRFNNPALVVYLRVFSIYPVLALPANLMNLLFVAQDRPVAATMTSALFAVITIGSTVMPSLFGMPLIYTFYAPNVGALVFVAGVMLYLTRAYRDQSFAWDMSLLRKQLAYALPLGLSSTLGMISKQLNKAVVSSSFSPEVYAVYSNGAFEIPFISLVTGSLMTTLIPEFVTRLQERKTAGSVWRLWNAASSKTALLLFPLSAVLLVFAREFMATMFSAKYVDSAPVFQVYLLLMVLRITQYGAILLALGLTQLLLYTSIAGLGLNLGLSVLMIRLFGMLGPAWANIIVTYLWSLVYLLIVCRKMTVRFRDVMPWKHLARIMAVALAAALVVWPMVLLPISYFGILLVGTLSYGLIYIVMLLLTHTVTVASVRAVGAQVLLRVRAAIPAGLRS